LHIGFSWPTRRVAKKREDLIESGTFFMFISPIDFTGISFIPYIMPALGV
jgi:hypothetical protein